MIAVDIGNTNVTVGRFSKKRLEKVYLLERAGLSKKKITKVFSQFKGDLPVLICSVSPEINNLFLELKRKVYLIGEDLEVPIRCYYAKDKVGADRLVAAYAAKKSEPHARMIIDFGTAITVDFLSKRGDYLGGIILPGINSTLKTLKSCSLLPATLKVEKVNKLIPKTTSDSINKGLREGFSAMLNGVVAKYRRSLKFSRNDKIIVTGGDFSLLKPSLNFDFKHKRYLVLEGLHAMQNKLND